MPFQRNTIVTDLEQTALAAFGLKSWTAPIASQYGNGLAPTSQTVHFTALPLRAGDVVTNIWTAIVVAAAGTAPTTIKLALLDKNGNRLAVTANLAADAKWTTVGFKSFAVATPYTAPTADVYMAAVLKDGVFGTTDVQLSRPTAALSALNGVWPNGVAGTGQTDITAGPLTYASGQNAFWFAVN